MSDNSSDINKSSVRLLNIIVKITRHIDNCLKTEIITNSKYNLLLDSVDNITNLLNNSNKYYSSKTETIITRQKLIDTVFEKLNTLIIEIGAPTIDDILYILYRIDINNDFNNDNPIHIFNTLFTPYKCELNPISDYNKKDDIERYNNICFYKLLPSENFLLNLRGCQMKLPMYSKNTLINIYGYFDVDPLNLNKRQLVQKYESFNINEITDSNKKFYNGYFNQLSLRDFIIYKNTQIKGIIEYKLSLVIKYKDSPISVLVKDFLNMTIEEQIDFLTIFLLHQKDNESQYMAYLLYDMISNESNLLKPHPLAEQVYNNLHRSVQKLFKMVIKNIEKKNKEFIEFNESDVSYEKRIMLMKTDDRIKNKAIEKYKEITIKSGDSSSKAQHYLDGLLKIPFGIYKKEPVIGFLNEFRTKLVVLLNEFNIIIDNDKLSSYEINNTLDKYSNQLENIKQFNYTYLYKNFKLSQLKTIVNKLNTTININPPECHNLNKKNICKMIVDYYNDEKNETNVKNIILQNFNFNTNDLFHHKLSILNTEWIEYKLTSRKYLKNVGDILDKAIYAQADAKCEIKRIVAQWINGDMKGYVFGFEGPPGTGKTSLAKKGISKCLGDRPFSFIAMGGSSNGSTLEGHNYTYLGSTWGKIVDILQECQCMNPIIYIDELDKISNTENGKELIGILTHLIDPSQNDEFQDRYFSGIKIDLSKVLFVFSYNDFNKLDPILADRIHRVKFHNIKKNEKKYIINNYLLPEFLNTVGLPIKSLLFDNTSLEYIIENYTSESGIRGLKQKVFEIVRELNLRIITTNNTNDIKLPFTITIDTVEQIFSNNPKLISKRISLVNHIGLVNGLYATASGEGGITVIQAFKTYSDVKLNLIITGQQGDVMKESVSCAKTISWNLLPKKIRKNILDDLNIESWGIHIHCPEAAVPKDGPSAGAAITLAMISLFTGIPVKNDVALTGEIDLNGGVHVIGGLEYKIEGGKKAGIKTICYPKNNCHDIELIQKHNEELFENIELIPVLNIWDVLDVCLEKNELEFNRFN